MNVSRMFLMAMIVMWTGIAGASVVFSDDFTGTDDSPVDPAKWLVGTNSGTATIQDNVGGPECAGDVFPGVDDVDDGGRFPESRHGDDVLGLVVDLRV